MEQLPYQFNAASQYCFNSLIFNDLLLDRDFLKNNILPQIALLAQTLSQMAHYTQEYLIISMGFMIGLKGIG
jgi:hypothetical protein